jgi:hypothetical protein
VLMPLKSSAHTKKKRIEGLRTGCEVLPSVGGQTGGHGVGEILPVWGGEERQSGAHECPGE